jgi:predicted MFS family arabinose efflux permease
MISDSRKQIWTLMIAAAVILLVTMGARQTSGLFLFPIAKSTGVSVLSISFALAVGQFMWGAMQPVFGAIAEKYGSTRVLLIGSLMLAGGLALVPFATSPFGILLTMGILAPVGAAAGSFSILIGVVMQRVPAERRSFASGFINAGGSLGQVVFAPLIQAVIGAAGWMTAMYTAAAGALIAIPFIASFRMPASAGANSVGTMVPALTLRQQLRIAAQDRSYLLLHAGFFTCGFHVAFLVTHLPGDLRLCGLSGSVASWSLSLIGLFNIAGSLVAGHLGQRHRMKYLLAGIYASRAALVAVYLFMPKTPLNVYLFAAGLGFTWLATVPPTSGLVAKLFGTRYLATLFGLTLFSHQVGGFLGAWLGGVAVTRFGNYDYMWYADIALALLAAVANLPIREARYVVQPAAA